MLGYVRRRNKIALLLLIWWCHTIRTLQSQPPGWLTVVSWWESRSSHWRTHWTGRTSTASAGDQWRHCNTNGSWRHCSDNDGALGSQWSNPIVTEQGTGNIADPGDVTLRDHFSGTQAMDREDSKQMWGQRHWSKGDTRTQLMGGRHWTVQRKRMEITYKK